MDKCKWIVNEDAKSHDSFATLQRNWIPVELQLDNKGSQTKKEDFSQALTCFWYRKATGE